MDGQPQPQERGPRLLAAHMRSLDPGAATARDRLEAVLGEELARKLLLALTPGRHSRRAA